MSWKFQTKFSLVWKNHWLNTQSSTAWWADPDTPSAGHSCTAQRSLKALFLLLSRALLRILSGALLCHLIMADFTLNITALLWELDWTFKARHIVAFFAFFSAAAFVELKCALLKKFLRVQNISILFFDTLRGSSSHRSCASHGYDHNSIPFAFPLANLSSFTCNFRWSLVSHFSTKDEAAADEALFSF